MKPGPNRVSMKHVAEAAGVSLMTVSRALKDNPRQSKATRERVQRIAREMGYRPHPYVSALMSELAQTRAEPAAVNLAIFHFDEFEVAKKHEYYQGICKRARALGYTPEPFHYDPARVNLKRLRSILIARGIRGIIFMPAPVGFTTIDFDLEGFAAATLGHTIVSPVIPRVACDLYATTFQALDELTRRGYTRIGMVSSDWVNRLGRFLYSAGLKTYQSMVEPTHHLVEISIDDPMESPAVHQKLKAWIRREKLEVIICPIFSTSVFKVLSEEFEIPRQLAYLHLLEYPDPKVTYLGQLPDFMGAKAVDTVVAMINRNEFQLPANSHTLATLPKWFEGKTVPFREIRKYK